MGEAGREDGICGIYGIGGVGRYSLGEVRRTGVLFGAGEEGEESETGFTGFTGLEGGWMMIGTENRRSPRVWSGEGILELSRKPVEGGVEGCHPVVEPLELTRILPSFMIQAKRSS